MLYFDAFLHHLKVQVHQGKTLRDLACEYDDPLPIGLDLGSLSISERSRSSMLAREERERVGDEVCLKSGLFMGCGGVEGVDGERGVLPARSSMVTIRDLRSCVYINNVSILRMHIDLEMIITQCFVEISYGYDRVTVAGWYMYY